MTKQPVIRQRDDLESITAGDKCILTELFHPDKDPITTGYSLAYAFVEPGGSTLNHYLEQSETYYIIRGTGTMYLDGEAHRVQAGSTYYIPPRCQQWLKNDGDERIEFLVMVDPPWTAEGEVIVDEDAD